jgi:hypothetical protein
MPWSYALVVCLSNEEDPENPSGIEAERKTKHEGTNFARPPYDKSYPNMKGHIYVLQRLRKIHS